MRRNRRLPVTVGHYAPAFTAAFLIHALGAAIATLAFRPEPPRPSPARKATVMVFSVPPEDPRFPGLNPVEHNAEDWPTAPPGSARSSDQPFEFDVDKIAGRAQVLFPFVTPGLALQHFSFPSNQYLERDGLSNGREGGSVKRLRTYGPLEASDAQLQRVVDQSWSRRDRWEAFQPILRLTRTYSAEAGRLADLLQRYCDQNSLQPYADAETRDPRLWVQLEIAADHVDFIAFIRRYLSDHPGTKSAITLLFLLDAMAQGSRDALAPLLGTNAADELPWTRRASPRAYRLVIQLERYYRRELNRRGLTSAEAITVHYERVRLAILDEILRTAPGGYRAGDALFLKGAIYWRQRRVSEALQAWRRISVDADDSHVRTYSQIRALLGKHSSEPAAADSTLARDINQTLKNAQGQWFSGSFDRLRQFGYRVDTF